VERDRHHLEKLYGVDMDGAAPLGVFNFYLRAAHCAPVTECGEQNANPDFLKAVIVQLIDIEIINLNRLEKATLGIERARSKYTVDRSLRLS
jgi:hypothetical protein